MVWSLLETNCGVEEAWHRDVDMAKAIVEEIVPEEKVGEIMHIGGDTPLCGLAGLELSGSSQFPAATPSTPPVPYLVAEPILREATVNLETLVELAQMECIEQPGDMSQLPIGTVVAVGDIQLVRANEDEEQPTPDVPTKVWEVGMPHILDEVRRSFLTFTDSASSNPETKSPPPGFQCRLMSWGMAGRSWNKIVAALDILSMAFRTW